MQGRKYIVEKRIINNYRVEVSATSPEDAIRQANLGNHEPGTLVSDNESGDSFYPSEWRVYEPILDTQSGELPEINFGIDRESLEDLD